MKRILVLVILLCIIGTTCFAEKNPNDISDKFNYLGFEPITYNENKIDVTIIGPIIAPFPDFYNREQKSMGYYIKKSDWLGSKTFFMSLVGMNLRIKNNTDDAIIVHWNKSVLTSDDFKGTPFLPLQMNLKDAGNQAYTPDTIIPPNDYSEVMLTTSHVINVNSETNPFPTNPMIVGSILNSHQLMVQSIYMCISDSSNQLKFYNFKVPFTELQNKPMHNGRLLDPYNWITNMLYRLQSRQNN
ncbi:hypothetical protein [Pectinatus haikarae]|uniref:Lipoprotein n=1 Tax=Pectinatus haikarae TaxID=349096 RepID=A0ABT9Y8F7_9FIRM|nr:hypothetical protein [Pectinatus haikarae]MDQ0204108.1 hypothetical protein [Pectinatus haikarae]